MTLQAAVILDDENLRIPAEVYTFDEFRHWSQSDDFPNAVVSTIWMVRWRSI